MAPIITQSASRLGNVRTLEQLAAVLGEQTRVLSYWLYKAKPEQKYFEYSVPKKSGGWRNISAPVGGLKRIQIKLARLLSEIYNDLEQKRLNEKFDGLSISDCVLAHGFKDKYSIITNANFHVRKRYVFNADLEDFFPSITFGRVRSFFIHNRNFNLTPETATMIAQLTCYRNKLPQGAPTSPVISNFVAHILDIALNKMAKKGNCSYTRYADDLTFSTNESKFPSAIARLVPGTEDRWVAGDGLVARVYASGFKINHDKSRMLLPRSRQEVTGLTVNRSVNVAASYYKLARSMCDHLFTGGTCFEMQEGSWTKLPVTKLQGRMDFIHSVRRGRMGVSLDHVSKKNFPISYREREAKFCDEQKAFSSLYRNLLNYISFHGNKKPIIVGEGITDGLYIRACVQTIGVHFPKLFDASIKDKVLIDFYKHSEKRKFYQIGEGASQLKPFIQNYTDLMKPFKTRPKNPVIIIVDNDDEGRDVLRVAGSRWRKDTKTAAPFYHLVANLYILPIPASPGSTSTSIEDLFDQKWLQSQIINGRKFTKNNDFDSATEFGKAELVGKIVRPNKQSIKWTDFTSLLDAIQAAIIDYETK